MSNTYIKTISFLIRTLMKRLNEKSHEKTLMKFGMFLSLYTTDYLIGLAFWAIPIAL